MLVALLLPMQAPKVAAPAAPRKAELRLSVDRASVKEDEDPGYHVVIRNTGREPLRLIHPQDGSEMGWRNPEIGWNLPDLKERTGFARCGNTNPIEESAFFTLAPGESKEISSGWAGYAQLRPGSNRVSFTYDISPKRKDNGFTGVTFVGGPPPEIKAAEERIAALYSRLTPIKLTSNVVRVNLQPRP